MSLPNFSRPSPTNGYYDVFLSFRGKDTRKGFATTLCRYLRRKKIHTFMDDRLLGHEINKLFEMIKKSRMAVVIYSESYASSDWCLQELVKILKRRKKEKQLLLPVFLEVDPSELINVTGKTQEYLDNHSLIEHGRRTLESWKDALREFGEVSGRLCFTDDDYSSEYEFIQNIEGTINKMLRECEQTRQYSAKSSTGAADLMKLQPSDQDFSRPSRNGYDVFLSFRGEDTRKGFTTNLCQFLRGKNIHTFMDDRPRGQEIDNLFVMIKKSRMAIVIYSERYASSDWCLQELVKILKRWKKEKQLMLPIFLKVNPSELKQLTGKTQEYLDTHNISEHGNRTIQSWKDAVRKIGEVSGLSYTDYDRWSEYEFIEKCVVERINEILAADSEEETEEEGSIKSSMDATAADQLDVLALCPTTTTRIVEIEEPSDHAGSVVLRHVFAKRAKGKKKELSPHDAAMLIQMWFRYYLIHKFRAFRELRELAVAKPKLKEISALFNNFSYRHIIVRDAKEHQRFSVQIKVLLLNVDANEGANAMTRASKKSMMGQLEAMLDVVDPQHHCRLQRGVERLMIEATQPRQMVFAKRAKRKKKELSPHDAASLIQMCFRTYLMHRSLTFRTLGYLAVAKSKLKEISALFNNFSYRRMIVHDAQEQQRFSERIVVLLLTINANEGADVMTQASKKSMVGQLEAMLDVVGPQHHCRPQRGGERLMIEASQPRLMVFAKRAKGKKKELSPHDAASLIQMCFRTYLMRRSLTFRTLGYLAVAKSKLKEISALFNNFSYRRMIVHDAQEQQRFSKRIVVLLLNVDANEGPDAMTRVLKKSMVDQLKAMLDVVDLQHHYRP